LFSIFVLCLDNEFLFFFGWMLLHDYSTFIASRGFSRPGLDNDWLRPDKSWELHARVDSCSPFYC
jgi:hypothetical protein